MRISKYIIKSLLTLFISFSIGGLIAQNMVSGSITDGDNGDALIGVNVIIKNTSIGTITDLDGKYSINTKKELPYTISVSLIGYETQNIKITSANSVKDIVMAFQSILADEIVVSASRTEEKILESPVTIEKLDLIAIKQSSSADYYDELTKLKGVHTNQASMTFNTINTRGFATAGNTRFVQLMDGMDNAAPLLNFPTGNVVGISELDISNVELVPGAASALYGPNAFNGILMMNSKNPFKYQGLSASVKGGLAMGDGYNNPLYGASVRYAKAVNDKLAFKFNVSYFQAQDWKANNYTGSNDPLDPNAKPGDVGFNGINLYGDETPIDLRSKLGFIIRRTGFREEDIQDNGDAKSLKLSGAVHYKLTDNIETNLSYRRGQGSTVYQGAERYALRDFVQSFYKWELNGNNWNIRSYISQTDDGDSYNMTALGAFTNERLFPTAVFGDDGGLAGGWLAAYLGAYLGNFTGLGVGGGSFTGARSFADAGGIAGLPTAAQAGFRQGLLANGATDAQADAKIALLSGQPRSNFKTVADAVRKDLFQGNPFGAGFIDDSRLYHTEANYDFTEQLNDVIGLLVGGSYRKYSLFTDGTVFNEDPDEDGVNERIGIGEFGIYTQVSKKILSDKLKLAGSVRYDKNENFDGNFTPRISMVYSAGAKRQHNFRASYQTGFRNPTTQGQYIFFRTTSILLGGSKANAEKFELYEGGAYSVDSYNAFKAAGGKTEEATGVVTETDPDLLAKLQTINLEYAKPERLQSVEVGYKGVIGNKLMMDANVYYNIYNDFIDQLNVVSKKYKTNKGLPIPAGSVYRPYTNSPAQINSLGVGLGMKYRLSSKWNVTGNFDYATFDVDEAKLKGTGWEGYNPGFNTPELKFNLGVTNRKIVKNVGFGVNYRWQSGYYYISSFGQGDVPAYGTLDAQVSYKIKSAKSVIKLGASNLIGTPYITNIGNPEIGRMVFLSWTYDQFLH